MTATLEAPLQSSYEIPKKVRFVGRVLTDEEVRHIQEKRKHYLEGRGLIDNSALDADGSLIDHFQDRSIWMGVSRSGDNALDAVGRLILTDGKSVDSLQMPLDAINEPDNEMIEAIRQNLPSQVGEVASLLQTDNDPQASIHLYAALKHVSTQHQVKYWLFGLRRRSEPGFKKIFGPALHKLGESVEIEGATEALTPYLIDIGQGVDVMRVSLREGVDDRFTRTTRQLFIDALDQYEAETSAAV